MVLIAKSSVKILSNVSQMKGWVIHNEGGFVKTVLPLWYAPSGCTQWGVNENFSPVHRESFTSSKCSVGDFTVSLSVTAYLKLYSLSFQCNVQVPIKAVQPPNNIPGRFKGIHDYLTPSLLSTVQTYLTLMKLLPYDVSAELTKVYLVHDKTFNLSRRVGCKKNPCF